MPPILQRLLAQAEKNAIWIAFGVGAFGLILLWSVQEYFASLLPAFAGILALVLATYISLRIEQKRWVKLVAWALVVLVAIATIYVDLREQRRETEYLDILSPDIAPLSALAEAETVLDAKGHYELIDVIGAYYICLRSPDTIFHRFPEWVLVFRGPTPNQVTEVRVSDSRLPPLPDLPLSEQHIPDGHVLIHMKFKVPLAFIGKADIPDNIRDVVDDIDAEGRTLVETDGTGLPDSFADVVESTNARVLARARPIGRHTDRVADYVHEDDPSRIGGLILAKATYAATGFDRSLPVIAGWRVDVEEAIANAIASGAKATAPGSRASFGVFRLNSGPHRNLRGPYWDLPFRIGIRPILVDARTGSVAAVNDHGQYATRW